MRVIRRLHVVAESECCTEWPKNVDVGRTPCMKMCPENIQVSSLHKFNTTCFSSLSSPQFQGTYDTTDVPVNVYLYAGCHDSGVIISPSRDVYTVPILIYILNKWINLLSATSRDMHLAAYILWRSRST
jgi:hypothetical protein